MGLPAESWMSALMNDSGIRSATTLSGIGGAIVEGVAVASDVHHDLGVDAPGAFGQQRFDCVGVLLGDAWPFSAGVGLWSGGHDPGREDADQDSSEQWWEPQGEGGHAIGLGAPSR